MPAFGSQPGLPAFPAANNKIFMDGKPIRLRGANWFGFEGANAVVDGLWERPMAEYVGFLASQGFNAVRVPLAMDNIANDPTVEYNMVKKDSFFNGIAHGRTSLEALDRLVALCAANGLLVMLDDAIGQVTCAVTPDGMHACVHACACGGVPWELTSAQ